MREIALSGGLLVFVDDVDYAELSRWRWKPSRGSGPYAVRAKRMGGKYVSVYMHRVIMGAQAGQEVDHVELVLVVDRHPHAFQVEKAVADQALELRVVGDLGRRRIEALFDKWTTFRFLGENKLVAAFLILVEQVLGGLVVIRSKDRRQKKHSSDVSSGLVLSTVATNFTFKLIIV